MKPGFSPGCQVPSGARSEPGSTPSARKGPTCSIPSLRPPWGVYWSWSWDYLWEGGPGGPGAATGGLKYYSLLFVTLHASHLLRLADSLQLGDE